MKNYVLIYAIPRFVTNDVLLVMKDRPEWQKGFLNLIGGKVEEGESLEECAIRELKEETGYEPYDSIGYCPAADRNLVKKLGMIEFKDDLVHCFSIPVNSEEKIMPRKGETEIVRWFPWRALKKDKRLMPNLRIIIPLFMQNLSDWKIVEEESRRQVSIYKLGISLLVG
jgi:8-oxo-dGTP pyrophosphatase MutT (NUDIX family)